MFSQRYTLEDLRTNLLSHSDFQPYPTVDKREKWEALPPAIRQSHIEKAIPYLNWEWPGLPATLYMDYKRTGTRARFEAPYLKRRRVLGELVLAECLEAKGRFIDDIINGLWHILEESAWNLPAHRRGEARPNEPIPDDTDPTIDLFSAETADQLAWAYYLLGESLDSVTPIVRERITKEVKRRLLIPFLERDDFAWMGFTGQERLNNWNPWINSNVLASCLLLEDNVDKRTAIVMKAMRSLDQFIDPYPADGGCDEGPGYWNRAGGSFFDCLDLLYHATSGKVDLFADPLVANMGRYMYKVHIDGPYFVDFADCKPRLNFSGELIYRYGLRVGDPAMQALGASLYHHANERAKDSSLLRLIPDVLVAPQVEKAGEMAPYPRDSYLPVIQVMTARERQGCREGLFLAAKGGHNQESHNHNDVGQFVVYASGTPILIDAGVGTYTAKTFSSQRYEIWTMQSAYHNLPTINGCQQVDGLHYAAADVQHTVDDRVSQLTMNLASTYSEEAGIINWQRSVRLLRDDDPRVELHDSFQLANRNGDTVLNLLFLHRPQVQPGRLQLVTDGGSLASITFSADVLKASVEEMPLEDESLCASWGESLWRAKLCWQSEDLGGEWLITVREESKRPGAAL